MKKSVTILYLIIASAVSIAIIGSVFFLVFSAKLDEYSRLSIHTNAQKIHFLEKDSGLLALKQLYSAQLSFTAFCETSTRPCNIGLLFSGDQNGIHTIASSITEGRFFRMDDFFSGHKYAVIGKNVSSEIYSASGLSWIDIDGLPFEVIGILDTGINSPIDECIYYNLDALSDVSLIYLDGNNTKQIQGSLSALGEYASLQTIDASKSGVSRLLGISSMEKFFLFLVVCSVIMFHCYSVRLLYFACGEFVSVRYLLGYSLHKSSSQVMLWIFCILSGISIFACVFGGTFLSRYCFGNFPFPVLQSLITLELSFALPSALYGKVYFLKKIERRFAHP